MSLSQSLVGMTLSSRGSRHGVGCWGGGCGGGGGGGRGGDVVADCSLEEPLASKGSPSPPPSPVRDPSDAGRRASGRVSDERLPKSPEVVVPPTLGGAGRGPTVTLTAADGPRPGGGRTVTVVVVTAVAAVVGGSSPQDMAAG